MSFRIVFISPKPSENQFLPLKKSAGDRKYHFTCFRCGICQQSIMAGDSYRLDPSGMLICFKHQFDQTEAENEQENSWNSTDFQSRPHYQYKVKVVADALNVEFRKSTSTVCLESILKPIIWPKVNWLQVILFHYVLLEHFDQRKTKRVRTSFKHYQIQLMKQAFAEKPNPDSNDLKKLSNQTGLAKRVLQVELRSKIGK